MLFFFFFFNDTATTEIYTRSIVGSVRCVQETGYQRRVHGAFKGDVFKPKEVIELLYDEDERKQHQQLIKKVKPKKNEPSAKESVKSSEEDSSVPQKPIFAVESGKESKKKEQKPVDSCDDSELGYEIKDEAYDN
eukprot:TRINITY_DN45968_c0_g1_i2.p1 TRINITY_DN45968_c0_g1~~TRINITY_DN45968_c0_g1_i2.p1  ORF type:complete len:135 (+),score=60.21 TRINITY_DN45968_c0_g1_i2:82-486(+)